MTPLVIQAPAKVNLSLRVHSRRRDGLHRLRTVVTMIDLCDTLHIAPALSPGLLFTCTEASLPTDTDNLVVAAYVRLRPLIGTDQGVKIHLEKHIPIAAGLAGGSADAAATLVGLRRRFDLPITADELLEHARALGADVPFFLGSPLARGEGAGDPFTPLKPPSCMPIVVVYPEIPVATRWAYEQYPDRPGSTAAYNKELLHALTVRDIEALGAALDNDLEQVVLPAHPEISEVKARLIDLGAAGALMSGSGSTVFAPFTDPERAFQAEEILRDEGWGATFATRTLRVSPLAEDEPVG